MELEKTDSGHFTNGLHDQFATEMKDLFTKHDPQAFNIVPQYNTFCWELDKENECYKIVRKDNYSVLKEEVDFERDTLVIGIIDGVKTALRHFKPEIKDAARRLKILLDEYNRPVPIVKQPYDAETASIENLLQNLNKKYVADMELTGITEWVKELATVNAKFEQLVKASAEQKAQKADFRMAEVRKNVDQAWKNIIALIKADMLRYGDEKYRDFVSEWNALVKHYNDIWAQHQGRNKAKKEKEEKKTAEQTKPKTTDSANPTITGQVNTNTSEQINTSKQVNVNTNTSGQVNKDTNEQSNKM
jgi:hypothetical protein